jgi:exopolysaccharide biosynthesis polyprenyl glycosylphosphotransferase
VSLTFPGASRPVAADPLAGSGRPGDDPERDDPERDDPEADDPERDELGRDDTEPQPDESILITQEHAVLREFGLDTEPFEKLPGGRVHRHRSVLPALITSDVIALAGAFMLGVWAMSSRYTPHTPQANIFESVPYLLLFVPVMACYGLYRRARRRLVASMFPDLSHLFHSLIIGCLLTLVSTGLIHQAIKPLPPMQRGQVALIGALAFVLIPVARAATRWLLRPSAARGSRVVVVGSGQVAAVVLQRLTNVDGMHVVGCVDDAFTLGGEDRPTNLLGNLDDLRRIVAEESVDHIIVAFSPATGAKLAGLLRSLADQVQISVVPRLFDLLTVRSHVDDLHGLPVVDVAPAALGPADRFAKRALDIVVSTVGLLIASPFLIGLAIAIKTSSPGPVLFRQERTGRNGDPFRICKFRTMNATAEDEKSTLGTDNEVDGPLFKIHDDPRITKVGGFLRKTSLDELPQMLNVFKGDMSLVGPRPFVTSESAEIAGWAARRFSVRPGMTGLWQISGRNDLPFEELCRLDYSYVASWSLWWDLRILWHTPASVLRRRGAY